MPGLGPRTIGRSSAKPHSRAWVLPEGSVGPGDTQGGTGREPLFAGQSGEGLGQWGKQQLLQRISWGGAPASGRGTLVGGLAGGGVPGARCSLAPPRPPEWLYTGSLDSAGTPPVRCGLGRGSLSLHRPAAGRVAKTTREVGVRGRLSRGQSSPGPACVLGGIAHPLARSPSGQGRSPGAHVGSRDLASGVVPSASRGPRQQEAGVSVPGSGPVPGSGAAVPSPASRTLPGAGL